MPSRRRCGLRNSRAWIPRGCARRCSADLPKAGSSSLHGDRMVRRDFAPGGRSALQLKDVRLICELAESRRIPIADLGQLPRAVGKIRARGRPRRAGSFGVVPALRSALIRASRANHFPSRRRSYLLPQEDKGAAFVADDDIGLLVTIQVAGDDLRPDAGRIVDQVRHVIGFPAVAL